MRILWDLPLTWLLLPFQLIIIFLLQLLQLMRNVLHKKSKYYYETQPIDQSKLMEAANKLYDESPIYLSKLHDLYSLRIFMGQKPDGYRHDTDHMCARQGIWVAITNRLMYDNSRAAHTLGKCIDKDKQELSRGYRVQDDLPIEYNDIDISGDMLVGLCFGYVHAKQKMNCVLAWIGQHLLNHGGLLTKGHMSIYADFRPFINSARDPVVLGAQNLTYLCALRCAIEDANANGFDVLAKDLKRAYWVRFIVYGGFLSVLFPTVGIWFKRGYNNDNVCMQAAYCLRRLSTTTLEKFVYTFAMYDIWLLSYPWLNGFFTGLLKQVAWVSNKYINRCKNYAYAHLNQIASKQVSKQYKAKAWPVDPYYRNMGEFVCDEDQEFERDGTYQYRSTLGQLAQIVWLI